MTCDVNLVNTLAKNFWPNNELLEIRLDIEY